jgi:putative ABC transport system permease protein
MEWMIFIDSLEQGLIYGIMALGVFISFRILDFPDLTVDSSFTLGAGVTASLMLMKGYDPLLATFIGTLTGILAGIVTGILNTKLKILNLLSGILTMTMLYSINLRIMGRPNIPLMGKQTLIDRFQDLVTFAEPYELVLLFLLLVLIIKLLLDLFFKTELGLCLLATGKNEKMITATGVNIDYMKILGLALSNGLVALSGALVAQYSGFADINMGIGTIIAGLASVIIGEALLHTKSIGWMTAGVVVGSVIYRTTIMIALRYGYAWGFQASDLKLITALIVIISLSAPQIRRRFFMKSSSREQSDQKQEG